MEFGLFCFGFSIMCPRQTRSRHNSLFPGGGLSNNTISQNLSCERPVKDVKRIRIGYGGPQGYQHGYRRPTGNLSEFERLLHLIVSLQILFGSRRGAFLIPLLLVGLVLGGWWAYNQYNGPDRQLLRADQKWNSGDTPQRIQAIRDYKALLRKKDPLDNGLHLLRDGRERLYRRIIAHHVLFDINDADANDWIREAWDEGIRDLGFQEERVKEKWKEATEGMKRQVPDRNPRIEEKSKKGDFGTIHGLDPQGGMPSNRTHV